MTDPTPNAFHPYDASTHEPIDPYEHDPCLTLPEVMKLLAVGEKTMRGLLDRGELQFLQVSERVRRVPLSEVQRYIAQTQQATTAKVLRRRAAATRSNVRPLRRRARKGEA